jgi:glucose-6-phosphate-specific signal transduction histidine kinase
MIEIFLPIATVSVSNVREHWAKRAARAKAHRQQAYLMTVLITRMYLRPPMTVKMIRVAPRQLDDDNLRGALKSIRDGIADRLGIDDRDPRVTWQYDQEKGRPKQRGVRLEVRL